MSRTNSPASAPRSPTLQMVILADRPRQAYVPSALLRTAPASTPPPPPVDPVDPVAEALQLIRADMAQQARGGGGAEAEPKPPVTIRLEAAGPPPRPPSPKRQRRKSPPPPPAAPSGSIFDDDIEEYCLRVRGKGGGGAAAVSDRFGELLQRQRAVRQLQQQLHAQNAEMRAVGRQLEQDAEAERRRRRGPAAAGPDGPPVPTTTAADTLLVLRETDGSCGAADLCLTPRDLPAALRLVHRLRCEVLELRACALRAAVAKNEVAAQLNRDRAQLRATFTRAQLKRLLGIRRKGFWDAEDIRRAIAVRRVLSRRQYRYLVDVMKIPLPSLRINQKARSMDAETRQLYDQLVAEKVRKHMTRRRRVERPAPASAHHPDALIAVATASSESEEEATRPAPAPAPARRRLKLAVTAKVGQQRATLTVAPPG